MVGKISETQGAMTPVAIEQAQQVAGNIPRIDPSFEGGMTPVNIAPASSQETTKQVGG